jgi:hypothetical protein
VKVPKIALECNMHGMEGVEGWQVAFQKVEVKADTDALRKALEAGLDVPGASLGVRGTHLRIR